MQPATEEKARREGPRYLARLRRHRPTAPTSRAAAHPGQNTHFCEERQFRPLCRQGCEQRRVFIVPREIANRRSYPAPQRAGRGFYVHKLIKHPQQEREGLADFENNFSLCTSVPGVEVVPGSWLAGHV